LSSTLPAVKIAPLHYIIHAKHIPEVYNLVADAESRVALDPSDWKLMPSILARLQMIWGPLKVDLFAAHHNKQLPRFFSFWPDPEAEAVDALAKHGQT